MNIREPFPRRRLTVACALLLGVPTLLPLALPTAAAAECFPFEGSDRFWYKVAFVVRDPLEAGAAYQASWTGENCFDEFGNHIILHCDFSVSDGTYGRISWVDGWPRNLAGTYKGLVQFSLILNDNAWCDGGRIFFIANVNTLMGRNANCDFGECGFIGG